MVFWIRNLKNLIKFKYTTEIMNDVINCDSCLAKQEKVKKIFHSCHIAEDRYLKIIELGRTLPLLALKERIPERIVSGCQSIVYLKTELKEGKIYFTVYSEALISTGLAALLLFCYNGEEPLVLLKCPPDFLNELGIFTSLSPARSNGLASMFLRMQQEAVKSLSFA